MAGCEPLAPLAGVVLDTFEHGESDLIVTLLTRERGRLAAIAKGAKRSRRRFVNALEPFTSLELGLTPPRRSSLFRLDRAGITASRPGLRFDHRRYLCACLVCELIVHWTREADPDTELFLLLERSLDLMEKGPPAAVLPMFITRLIRISGHLPLLDACVRCGSAAGGTMRLSPALHGLVCPRCDPMEGGGDGLNPGEIRAIRELAGLPQNRAEMIRIPRKGAARITRAMLAYSTWLLQREPAGWRTVEGILAEP